ncbi:Hypothetical protein SCF082_LOCUS27409 [Durusdinium trenchii]|uniref:Aspartyl/asparaginy/proline hydroxylase domain-containing protein n=1 Tax=Durusdinium trenchii TaxID=1381693 RepID=A0ABP0MF92_9DINO
MVSQWLHLLCRLLSYTVIRSSWMALNIRWVSAAGKDDAGESGVVNSVENVWPMVVMRVSPLQSAGGSQTQSDWLGGLAEVGEQGFLRYLKEVIPLELKLDQPFADAFHMADESRWNLGFFRWQKRVYSKVHKVSVQEILWDGKPVPALPGVNYQWEELHKAKRLKSLVKSISEHLGAYKKVAEANLQVDRRGGFRFIPWVEVYRPGEFQHPHAHTGSPVVGIIALKCGFETQRMIIEDPRGINPPFGRKYQHAFKQGDMILFPSWASHFMDPNRHNETHVFLSFAIQGPGGVKEFDWEDDGIGSLVKTVRKTIRATKQPVKSTARSQREEL